MHAIAHLADNVVPFVAVANGLRHCGFSAPIIHHADLDHGLLIIEDLGDAPVVTAEPSAPIGELRNNGMSIVNRVAPLKRWLTARALDS